jgi:hypothetical protein
LKIEVNDLLFDPLGEEPSISAELAEEMSPLPLSHHDYYD